MQLNLNEVDVQTLKSALEVHLLALRSELVHTDDREYRHELRDTIDRLEAIAERMVRLETDPAARELDPQEQGMTDFLALRRRTAGEVMHPDPATGSVDDLVLEVAARMAAAGVRHLPIVGDNGHVVGMLSDRDIREAIGTPLRLAADGILPEALVSLRVSAVMTPDPITVTPEVSLAELARIFARKRIGACPVVGPEGRLRGIVSYVDVLSALTRPLPAEVVAS